MFSWRYWHEYVTFPHPDSSHLKNVNCEMHLFGLNEMKTHLDKDIIKKISYRNTFTKVSDLFSTFFFFFSIQFH